MSVKELETLRDAINLALNRKPLSEGLLTRAPYMEALDLVNKAISPNPLAATPKPRDVAREIYKLIEDLPDTYIYEAKSTAFWIINRS